MVIGIDVDGILARFNNSFANIITKQTGVIFPQEDDTWPNVWDWDLAGLRLAGYDEKGAKEASRAAWKVVMEDFMFWKDLPAYDGADRFISELDKLNYADYSIYFITQRRGDDPKYQTEQWLDLHGFLHPTVLISGEKGELCHALNVDYYIDDKNENCVNVAKYSPSTKCYMLARPWNTDLIYIPRLNNLDEFLEVIKNGK